MKIAIVTTSFCPNISYTQNVRGHIAAMVDFGHSIYNNSLWGNTIIIGVQEVTGWMTSIWLRQSWEP